MHLVVLNQHHKTDIPTLGMGIYSHIILLLRLIINKNCIHNASMVEKYLYLYKQASQMRKQG